ncbi:MAG: VWA domain-containing protein [Deltaproteobacteria bacterium]|nr:VWA domain-containing protein [Deltaproteobacteria bacterium]
MSERHARLEVRPVTLALAPGSEQTEYVLLRVTAPELAEDAALPALTAVLVLDVSGSMAGEPLRHVAASSQKMAELLHEGDRLGVVAFQRAAHTVAPVAAMSPEGRRAVKVSVGALVAGGNTNISAGLSHAALLLPSATGEERQALVLLSDGQPNEGTTSVEGLAEEVSRVRARGVSVSTLGFGPGHADKLLLAMADAGGGRYAYVSDPTAAAVAFARALGAQRDVVCEGARVVLSPCEGVELLRVLGAPPTTLGAAGLSVALGDLVSGDERNLVLELRVRAPAPTGDAPGAFRALKVQGRWRPRGSTEEQVTEVDAVYTLTPHPDGALDPVAQEAAAVARADELRTEARDLADQGHFERALERLKLAQALLEVVPGFAPGGTSAASDAWDTLKDEMDLLRKRPDAARYREYKLAAQDYLDFKQGSHRSKPPAGFGGGSRSAVLMAQGTAGAMPRARLLVHDPAGMREVPLTAVETTVGRVPGNHVVLALEGVSKHHARVLFNNGRFFLADLQSTNGTQLKGRAIQGAEPLADGDRFDVGGVVIEFRLG